VQTYKADLALFKWEFKKCDGMVKNDDETALRAKYVPRSKRDACRIARQKALKPALGGYANY